MARHKVKRVLAWFGLLALGIALAGLVLMVVSIADGEEPDGTNLLLGAFWGFVAFGAAGMVATWWFARPRPSARRWLVFGLPAVAALVLLSVSARGTLGALMLLPLSWTAAMAYAVHPPEPPAPSTP